MFYGVVGHTYVSLHYLGVTNKEPQEIDANFDENNLITFHVTIISDIMLHILSCITMLKNTKGKS